MFRPFRLVTIILMIGALSTTTKNSVSSTATTTTTTATATNTSSDSTSTSKKIHVEVNYGTLCPTSIWFIQNYLWPTYWSLYPLIQLDLYSYGRAEERKVNGEYVYYCQHGEYGRVKSHLLPILTFLLL